MTIPLFLTISLFLFFLIWFFFGLLTKAVSTHPLENLAVLGLLRPSLRNSLGRGVTGAYRPQPPSVLGRLRGDAPALAGGAYKFPTFSQLWALRP